MEDTTKSTMESEEMPVVHVAAEVSGNFVVFDILEEEPAIACNTQELTSLATAADTVPQTDPEKELSAVWQQESEFLDYMLYSLHGSDKTKTSGEEPVMNSSSKGPKKSKPDTSSAKVGLDHLDNLCKLMEQLGELRDQNVKLQRRVQYLEDMKTLQEMHRDLQLGLDDNSSPSVRKCSTDSLDVDYAALESTSKSRNACLPQLVRQHAVAMEECMEAEAELLTPTNLVESAIAMQSLQATYVVAERSHKPKHSHMRFKKPSLMKYRQRSKSVGYDDPTNNPRASNALSANPSVVPEEGPTVSSELMSSALPAMAVRSKAKVSKWTRVKEAFGWERPQEMVYKPPKAAGDSDKINMNAIALPDVSKPDGISKLDADLEELPDGPETAAGMSSSSSSSSSICLLESEILKSLAEAQEALGATSHHRRASTLGFGILPSSRMGSKICETDIASRPHHVSPNHRPNSVGFEGEAELWLSKTQFRHEEKYVPVSKEFDPSLDIWKYPDEPSFEEEPEQEKMETGSNTLEQYPAPPADVSGASSKRQKPCLTISVPSEETPDLPSLEGPSLQGSDAIAVPKFLPRVVGETPKAALANVTSVSTSSSLATDVERDHPPKNYSPPALLSKARVCTLEAAPMSSATGYRRSPHTKWSRVKKAFLSTKRDSRQARSVPSSPSKLQTFTFDENLLSAEPMACTSDSDASRDPSPTDARESNSISPSDLKERKEEFVQALTQPRSIEPELIPVVTPLFQSVAKETVTNLAPEFAKKAEPLNKQRASLLLNAESATDDLPPEFRKKLRDWEKMKQDPKCQTKASTCSGTHAGSRDNSKEKNKASIEQLPPDFKKKLAEWENRKTHPPSTVGKPDQAVEGLPEEFKRKLQEWEKIKASGVHLGKPASPKLDRKGSASQQRRKTKPNKSSKDEIACERQSAVKQKTDIVYREKQKDKDLQWLEKELQKIEKEKQRLEREREKYIEREMRLEKMRQAMKQPQLHKEICIKTSTGEFRFEGISHQFTKKLWEWEEQRGIRPEASTIALLDPQHVVTEQPPRNVRPKTKSLIRSKSEGSLADLTSPSVHSQPSSLSLNETGFDYDQSTKKIKEYKGKEREIQSEWQVQRYRDNQTPDELGSSSEWESKRNSTCMSAMGDSTSHVQRSQSIRTHASYQLLQENMALLNSLRDQEAIYRNLESQMTSLEGTMAGIEDTTGRLRERESSVKKEFEKELKNQEAESLVEDLKLRIATLQEHGDRLKAEKQQLQSFFEQHIQKQSSLAQQLVQKMKELEIVSHKIPVTVTEESFAGSNTDGEVPGNRTTDPSALARIQTLSSELISHAQELEKAVTERIEATSHSPTDYNASRNYSPLDHNLSMELSNKVQELQEELLRLEPPATSTMYHIIPQPTETEPPPAEIQVDPSVLRNVIVPTQRAIFYQTPISGQGPAIIKISPAIPPSPTEPTSPSKIPWRKQRKTSSPESPNPPSTIVPSSPLFPTIQVTSEANNSEGCDRSDPTPWRKKSVSRTIPSERDSTTSSEELKNLTPSPQPPSPLPTLSVNSQIDQKLTVRETAPNIKRMIAKYNAKATNSGKDAKHNSSNNILPLVPRPKEPKTLESPVSEACDHPATPITPSKETPEEKNVEVEPKRNFLQAPVALCKSQSAGSVITPSPSACSPSVHNPMVASGVMRSRSGNACNFFTKTKPTSAAVRKSPERTPSFFARTSPLDPSIDETLQKYRNRGKVNAVPDLPRSPAIKERAERLKKAREEFLTLESSSPSPTTTPDSAFQFSRHSTVTERSPRNLNASTAYNRLSTTSEESIDRSNSPEVQISKSASAGAVPKHGQHTQVKRSSQRKSNTLATGCFLRDSLTVPKEQENVLVLKQSKFYAVSALCRQSLLMDIAEPSRNNGQAASSEAPNSTGETEELSRSCPSSPALSKNRRASKSSWFLQPKKLFRKKSPQP